MFSSIPIHTHVFLSPLFEREITFGPCFFVVHIVALQKRDILLKEMFCFFENALPFMSSQQAHDVIPTSLPRHVPAGLTFIGKGGKHENYSVASLKVCQ